MVADMITPCEHCVCFGRWGVRGGLVLELCAVMAVGWRGGGVRQNARRVTHTVTTAGETCKFLPSTETRHYLH